MFRAVGIDVHRDFCEVAISHRGRITGGRVLTTPAALELFAQSLALTDRVALEATGNAAEIARIVRPHVGAVIVVSPHDTAVGRARAKTDRLDARTLARLLAAGELDAVWVPDEDTRAMRRRLSQRSQLVRSRTRAKNEVHAVMIRRLKGRPPVSDVFGARGRRWLAGLDLPEDERDTVSACLRHVEFLDAEIAVVDRAIAERALRSPDTLRLNLGLDPKVRQSGSTPARHGRITKQGSASVRHVLVEAAWVAVRQPGPLRAFYERVRARLGAHIAAVATARKIAHLCWCLLTRQQDYAFGQPSLTAKKIRALELATGSPSRKGKVRAGHGARTPKIRKAEHAVIAQAEQGYRRTITDWTSTAPRTTGASATPGHASDSSSKDKAAWQTTSP